MSEQMTFPDTWEEFEKFYGFTDKEQIYTNGSRLIPSFRVEQWLDHYSPLIDVKELKKRLKNSSIFNNAYPKWVDEVIDHMPIVNSR